MTTTKRRNRGSVRRYDLGRYEVGYNTAPYSYCTKSMSHHQTVSFVKGDRDESALPPCHCGAPMKFGYPAWVTRILSVSKLPKEFAEVFGASSMRHTEQVERRYFRLARQQRAFVDRMVVKYRNRKR
jgi:hypothetical protein